MKRKSPPHVPKGYIRIAPKLPDLEELLIIAERARRDGFITINDLASILSSDDSYTDQLPDLWEGFQISIRKSFPDETLTPENRFGVWYALLERWINKTVAGIKGGLRPIKGLPGYMDDPIHRKLLAVDGTDNAPDYVMLDDARSYFTDYLKIHLPALLFPPDAEATDVKKEIFAMTPQQSSRLTEPVDPEAFIRSLQISYVSDTEISVKVGGGPRGPSPHTTRPC